MGCSYLLFVGIITTLCLHLSHVSVVQSSSIVKRSSGSSIDTGMTLIEEAAKLLNQSQFKGDPEVVQRVDRVNSKTYYKQGDKVIFERESIDSGKTVVVLKAGEDGLQMSKKKRVFVVLKKQEKETKTYWITFAYLRELFGSEVYNDKVTINNENFRIEWDTWMLRGTEHNAARALGWTTCTESVFVACKKDKSKSEDDYDDEVTAVNGVQLTDVQVDVTETKVQEPKWGLNAAAESSVGKSDFVASLTGKAGYQEATNDGSGTTSGGDMEETFDFFADLDDSSGDGRAVGAAVEVLTATGANTIGGSTIKTGADFFSQKGWKTQDLKPQELSTKLHSVTREAFIGYGTCPYKKQTPEELGGIKTPMGIVKFYLATLRNDCSQRHLVKLLRLILYGVLAVKKDNTFTIPPTNKLLITHKLTPNETEDLARAYESAMFSQAFAAELRHPSPASVDPEGRPISRSVFTMIRMALHTLDDAKQHIPAHYILVTRSLVQTLKSTNTKSVQDYDRIKACKSCPESELTMAVADIYSLQAIQLFIMKGTSKDVKTKKNAFDAYEHYFKTKSPSIATKTMKYLDS